MAAACEVSVRCEENHHGKDQDNRVIVLVNAFSKVLTDPGFELPTENAQKALECAKRLKAASEEPSKRNMTLAFATYILTCLVKCCSYKRSVQCHTVKEKMWESYHKLCCSDVFRHKWVSFVTDMIGIPPSPILYMFVTDKLMEDVIKNMFPVNMTSDNTSTIASLDIQESNAISYTAGYVLRSTRTKLSRSASPIKNSLLKCIEDIIIQDDKTTVIPETEEWTNLIDRGGLIHVSDEVYMVFSCMELELRKHLKLKSDTSLKDCHSNIISNEEVLFYWSIVAVNWDEEESMELLKWLTQHWITIRGFSYASAFMEHYKQSQKKSTQKAKALRKTLNASKTSSRTPGPSLERED